MKSPRTQLPEEGLALRKRGCGFVDLTAFSQDTEELNPGGSLWHEPSLPWAPGDRARPHLGTRT